jgi:hypothetical protein
LHSDQKDIVEAALAHIKKHTGTAFDTVALEYMAISYMGTGVTYGDITSHLNAEYKKAGETETFLKKITAIIEKIIGDKVLVLVGEVEDQEAN